MGIASQQRRDQRRRVRGELNTPERQGQAALRERADQMTGLYYQDRQDQQAGLEMARARAAGEAPSLAQAQLEQAQQQNLTTQLGLASQARGGSLAAQQRQASAMGSAAATGTAQQMAQLRAAEQAQAEQAYMTQANQLAQQQMNREMLAQQQLQQMYGQMYAGGTQAAIAGRQQDIDAQLGRRQVGMEAWKNMNEGLATAGEAIGGMAMSDPKVKEDITPAEEEALEALKGLEAVSYRYKKAPDGSDRYGRTDTPIIGITTTDLKKSKAGAQLVKQTPDGEAFDIAGGLSLALAGLSALEKRVANG